MRIHVSPTNWNNPASDGRIELVFAGRKKEFGAYVIRKEYENFCCQVARKLVRCET